MLYRRLIPAVLALAFLSAASGETVTVAVASNFARPAHDIAKSFETSSGHSVRITTASTGKLYAQIVNGAPFDVLLAADKQRPQLLEDAGHGAAGTRFTYAVGRLVLWSQNSNAAAGSCTDALAGLGERHLAIANPLTAPYGVAAKDYLLGAGLWTRVEPRLVYGENISQTLHFVVSGNAEFGLIALSQAADARVPDAACEWLVPESMHRPIEQQAIQLQRSEQSPAAADFLAYLTGPESRAIIGEHGYRVPQ